MIFIRRDRQPAMRLTGLRVGLFFLAAGLWLAGVRVGSELVTWLAMGVAVVAILIGVGARWGAAKDDQHDDQEEVSG